MLLNIWIWLVIERMDGTLTWPGFSCQLVLCGERDGVELPMRSRAGCVCRDVDAGSFVAKTGLGLLLEF
jgi:hypothetical protein